MTVQPSIGPASLLRRLWQALRRFLAGQAAVQEDPFGTGERDPRCRLRPDGTCRRGGTYFCLYVCPLGRDELREVS